MQAHREALTRRIGGYRVPCWTLLVVCILIIFAYGYFLRATSTRDVLAKEFWNHPLCPNIDGWSCTHFVFFGLLGVLFPGAYATFFTAGVVWEVVETYLGQHKLTVSGKRIQLIGDQDAKGNPTGNDDNYWYGKSSDIIVNIAGYILGSTLATAYWPNEWQKRGVTDPHARVSPVYRAYEQVM